jgi:hypothetical protein
MRYIIAGEGLLGIFPLLDLWKLSENHRLKAVAPVTGCKPCSGQRPAK